ncbi:CHAP domain-containing protein [Chromobacterium vaccinii]|uniref:CHAP domain-containing protein n=1 Tax=Chromobacterium vaccinii TaxID=1108595 RepID=UPI003261BA03
MELVQTAMTQLGVEEQPRGSNDGPKVRQYLQAVGIGFPAAWCMAFVYWCAQRAAEETGAVNPLLKTGGVLRQWNERPALRVSAPQPGDVFIMDFGKGLGHTGIVERVDGDKLLTIEGNTNASGGREGYAVCRRVRSAKLCKGFLRVGL